MATPRFKFVWQADATSRYDVVGQALIEQLNRFVALEYDGSGDSKAIAQAQQFNETFHGMMAADGHTYESFPHDRSRVLEECSADHGLIHIENLFTASHLLKYAVHSAQKKLESAEKQTEGKIDEEDLYIYQYPPADKDGLGADLVERLNKGLDANTSIYRLAIGHQEAYQEFCRAVEESGLEESSFPEDTAISQTCTDPIAIRDPFEAARLLRDEIATYAVKWYRIKEGHDNVFTWTELAETSQKDITQLMTMLKADDQWQLRKDVVDAQVAAKSYSSPAQSYSFRTVSSEGMDWKSRYLDAIRSVLDALADRTEIRIMEAMHRAQDLRSACYAAVRADEIPWPQILRVTHDRSAVQAAITRADPEIVFGELFTADRLLFENMERHMQEWRTARLHNSPAWLRLSATKKSHVEHILQGPDGNGAQTIRWSSVSTQKAKTSVRDEAKGDDSHVLSQQDEEEVVEVEEDDDDEDGDESTGSAPSSASLTALFAATRLFHHDDDDDDANVNDEEEKEEEEEEEEEEESFAAARLIDVIDLDDDTDSNCASEEIPSVSQQNLPEDVGEQQQQQHLEEVSAVVVQHPLEESSAAAPAAAVMSDSTTTPPAPPAPSAPASSTSLPPPPPPSPPPPPPPPSPPTPPPPPPPLPPSTPPNLPNPPSSLPPPTTPILQPDQQPQPQQPQTCILFAGKFFGQVPMSRTSRSPSQEEEGEKGGGEDSVVSAYDSDKKGVSKAQQQQQKGEKC
ncbi:uncharacterized protein SEPMUDRAFT_112209 [Sphaerulina musiva SO2202]|uniref:Uncharacterized protein n=1 Tax=Sphaerulina musiva (strain SO2202) TaxID=692275 RepID=M3CWY5_SPHMS|nr:uncharacterized protein SEPMUDRAFT_112209 [Sphaerulina musiva SO2202]EMF08191.1 hypothetical protein SEPMUDRAFT_112209 [Sphaerulina musiva SO2202]